MATLRRVHHGIPVTDCAFSTHSIFIAEDADPNSGTLTFFTIGVLLRLLSLLAAQLSGGTSVSNVFLGVDGLQVVSPISLAKGREEAAQYRDVLIHVDEVPALSKINPDPYYQCLFLRNLIRCMFLPCLLSGTESNLVDERETLPGSRFAGFQPWVWLLTKFPRNRQELPTAHISSFERELLKKTRPLFANWFIQNNPPPSTNEHASNPHLFMSPESLSKMKDTICRTKVGVGNDDTNWLHASVLLVFADSLEGSGDVDATVPVDTTDASGVSSSSDTSSHDRHLFSSTIGRKRKRDPEMRKVMYHSRLIRNHFGLLRVPEVPDGGMLVLYTDMNKSVELCTEPLSPFKIKAAFKTCSQDPLLYLACLRDGIKSIRGGNCVKVPSTYAFSQFREETSLGNSRARSNDGVHLENEGIAACVLASHCYTTFDGTPFLDWLGLMIAELSPREDFATDTQISQIPSELCAALAGVRVPILSAANCPWDNECRRAGINCGNMLWCANELEKDGQVALSPANSEQDLQNAGERDIGQFALMQNEHYRHLDLEFKDYDRGFGGDKAVVAVNKGGANHICVLIGTDLSAWQDSTVDKFDKTMSVYRMDSAKTIERLTAEVSERSWEAGRKVVITVDLKKIYPDRFAVVPHRK